MENRTSLEESLLQSFFCVKTVSDKVVYKAFIGLTIRAKNDCWGRPLLDEILGQIDHVGAKWPIFYLFLLVAPQP